MKRNPHSIFNALGDRISWDKYAEQLDHIELSDAERIRATKSLKYLQRLLGSNFLKKSRNKNHPFFVELQNSAPRARLRLINFAETVQGLEQEIGFEQIADKFRKAKDTDQFLETVTVVSAAIKFKKAGFSITFEPNVQITVSGSPTVKKPDFKITNDQTREQIIIEISRLRESDAETASTFVFHTIYGVVQELLNRSWTMVSSGNTQINNFILPYVNIHPELRVTDLALIVEKLNGVAETVRATNQFQELIIENKIEIAISPAGDHSKAKDWAEKRKMDDIVESPPILPSEVRRVRRKISDKVKQLPINTPGVVIIDVTKTLVFYTHLGPALLGPIQRDLHQYPQLMCIGLNSAVDESPLEKPIIVLNDRYIYTKRTHEDLITEQKFFILNEGFGLKISDSTLEMMRRALIEY